jgi:hypothetical protein
MLIIIDRGSNEFFFHVRCDRSYTKVTIVYNKIRKMMPSFHFFRYRDDTILNLFVYIFIYFILTYISKNHSNNYRTPVFDLWLERVKSRSTIALKAFTSALFFRFLILLHSFFYCVFHLFSISFNALNVIINFSFFNISYTFKNLVLRTSTLGIFDVATHKLIGTP